MEADGKSGGHQHLMDEGLRIVDEATARHVTLRLMGALAIEYRCPTYRSLSFSLGRQTADVDLVGVSKQWSRLIEAFEAIGYVFDERHAMLHGSDRINFFHESGFRIDVFLDRLKMCHTLALGKRLSIDDVTLPLADLLLQKLQIIELTRKDVIDLILLLREHDVADDEEEINGAYVAELLSGDWGFYKTATTNLQHVRDNSLYEFDVYSEQDRRAVTDRIEDLLEKIEAHPKTLAWKARAKIGTRVKWYEDVDELVR